MARLHLNALGLTVHLADNGAAAVEKAGRTHYDLAMLDLGLLDMDGLEACRAIRSQQGSQGRPPIVIWTASMLGADHARAAQVGADAVLGKPFELRTLKQILARFLIASDAPLPSHAIKAEDSRV